MTREQLDEFDRFFQITEDDYEDFEDELSSVPKMDREEYLDFLASRAATAFGQRAEGYREFLVTTMLEAYRAGTEDERRVLLDLLEEHPYAHNQAWGYLREYRWRHQKARPEDKPELLRTILLLAVLTGKYLDEVATAQILTSVWGDAEDAGLDPAEFWHEAADLADDRPVVHGKSRREMLRDFEPYIY